MINGKLNENIWDEQEQCWKKKFKWTHICSGKSLIGDFRIDVEPSNKPDLVADILTVHEIIGKQSQDRILIDPPWQIDYNSRRQWGYAIRDLLKIGGIALVNAPWSFFCKGLSRHPRFQPYLVEQAFNSYRDLTLWWVYIRTE